MMSVCISNHLLWCISGRDMFGFGTINRAAGSLLESRPKKSESISLTICIEEYFFSAIQGATSGPSRTLQATFFQYLKTKCKPPSMFNCFMKWQLIVLLATPSVVKCLVQCYELNYVGLFLIHSIGVLVLNAIAKLLTNCCHGYFRESRAGQYYDMYHQKLYKIVYHKYLSI